MTKPRYEQLAIGVPDPGSSPRPLPSPIKLRRMPLGTPAQCEARVEVYYGTVQCKLPAVTVLQLPNDNRRALCEAHAAETERYWRQHGS